MPSSNLTKMSQVPQTIIPPINKALMKKGGIEKVEKLFQEQNRDYYLKDQFESKFKLIDKTYNIYKRIYLQENSSLEGLAREEKREVISEFFSEKCGMFT